MVPVASAVVLDRFLLKVRWKGRPCVLMATVVSGSISRILMTWWEGVLLVLQTPEAHNQIFNLTHGHSRSIAELLAVVKQFFPEAQVEHVLRDSLMPFRGALSVRKAQELLDYTPAHSIEVGMARISSGIFPSSVRSRRVTRRRHDDCRARCMAL